MASAQDSPSVDDGAPVRRFGLLDGMALIAAFAACWVVHRTFKATLPARMYKSYDISDFVLMHVGAWLLALTVALAASVAFVPRPGGRDRFRRPGALAVLMVTLTWAFNVVQVAIQAGCNRLLVGKTFDDPAFWWLFGPILEVPPRAGLAVLAAWVTLALLGSWQPSKDWLDRSGRVLGWIWIVWGPLRWISELLKLVLSNNHPWFKS